MSNRNKIIKKIGVAVLSATLLLSGISVPVKTADAGNSTLYNQLNINKNMQTINSSSRYGQGIKYIVIHYTGAVGSAYNNTQYFKNGYRGSSAHYFVGYSGEIWQSTADGLAAWSVGGKKYPGTAGGLFYLKATNYNTLNIEMCVRTKGSTGDTSRDWYFEDETIKSTVNLTRALMQKYDVPASRVIRHYDVVGKYCPNPFVLNDDPVSWNDFKGMLQSGNTGGADGNAGNSSGGGNEGQIKPPTNTGNKNVNVYYAVETRDYGRLPEVRNREDYAGWGNSPIENVKIRVDQGSVKYRVHIKGGGWLPYVTGCSWSDYNNGYAGNGRAIDALEVYYYTPGNIRPYKKAVYRVAPTGGGYYPYQHDNERGGGQDGYAGLFGRSIQKLQICIE